jgi:hypothetical protein
MTHRQSASLSFVQILDEASPLLLRRSQDRRQVHKRKIEDLHQNLANRGIDIAFEPVMSQFIDQCRLHMEEDIQGTWGTVRDALKSPYPSFTENSLEEILSRITSTISSLEDVMSYFHEFDVRQGRPELKAWVERLKDVVLGERDAQMKLLRVEIVKFLDEARHEQQRLIESSPTYLDQKLRWIKNNRFLAWSSLIISAIGILGGLSVALAPVKKWVCDDLSLSQCALTNWAKFVLRLG